MRKHSTTRVGLAAALLLGLGLVINGCTIDKPVEPDLSLGTLDATSFVALGNSLTAGVVSGGLGGATQANSFPALLAAQLGVTTFAQPTISEPGIPNKLEVQLLGGNNVIVAMSGTGAPTNSTYASAYNNLAVPGANTVDFLTDDGSTAATIGQVVLRGLGTAITQAGTLSPTLLWCWIGANDVLGGAVYGQIANGVTTVPSAVTTSNIATIFALLDATGADVVVANVPDVTALPYVTYLTKGFTSPLTNAAGVQTVFPVITTGVGAVRQATADDYLLLPAATTLAVDATYGGPTNPISDAHTLDADEVTELQSRITAMNTAIATQATAIGATLVDAYSMFNNLATFGVAGITEGGNDYAFNALFVSDGGMVMSLDGVHPSTTGYTYVANKVIDELNTEFGASIPHISYAGVTFPRVAPGKIPLDRMPDYTLLQQRLMEMYRVDR
ncbi:SGNH/GDSL hydrolase family protein [Candidatus Zixiibacteriota bacterium]